MAEWLYKARDRAASGKPRPDYEATRAFAVSDGILCRSARTEEGAWIANVRAVDAGDVIHIYYRQHAPERRVRVVGSFRVRDPGDARFHWECDLAEVKDAELASRLRIAYGAADDAPITGWLLEPAPNVHTPASREPDVKEFLAQTPTLRRYHEDRIISTVTAQLPALPTPLRLLHGPLLVTIETWSYGARVARFPAARIIGEGRDDASAVEALAENIAEFVEVNLPQAQAGRLGGTLAKQWVALTAMVDVSAVRPDGEKISEVA
ncbi:hypothetical protein WME94_26890 [Sorangium sp. So ce429]